MSSKQRLEVWNGARKKTSGGLQKKDLIKNKRGRIVSKKKSLQAADQATQAALARLKPGQEIETTQLAAWTVISRVLLNLSETITRN